MFSRYEISIGEMLRRYIEVATGQRPQMWFDRDLPRVDFEENTDVVALVRATGNLRDVGGRVTVAEIEFAFRLAGLDEDLAATVGVEAARHHPIVAGQIFENPGSLLGETTQRGASEDHSSRPLEMVGEIDGRTAPLELENQTGFRGR
jgi:hypothetical protein